MAHDSGAPSTMTREQLLERAASLIPTLRERAVSCEAARS